MAKRKRLSPAQSDYLSAAPAGKPALGTPSSVGAAPIAQVASDASAQAALQELSGVLENARAKGLMIEELPLAAIDENHLVRDRIEQDEEELQSLMDSIRARGQQTPAEVVPLEDAFGGRTHGLISGWRRLTALRRLYEETSDPQFATLKALVIHPDSAEGAYVAMVEENEIRVNLSHYERARIAVRACKEGVFTRRKYALQALFGNATRAKRSKIGSFVTLVEALDAVLFYPTAISEKLGLALVRAIEADEGFAERATAALQAADRSTPEAELAVLTRLVEGEAAETPKLEPDTPPAPPTLEQLAAQVKERNAGRDAEHAQPPASPVPPLVSAPRVRGAGDWDAAMPGERIILPAPRRGVRLAYTPGEQKIEISGEAVSAALVKELEAWLKKL
ncbi:ParB/RepB/Spo0J family partition protein [Leisingera sp. ANG-DT]|uniref:ParB/RepB/Spo0J family partition protein n=1 Tax=Leisingera sp. ANG-DT TaxID=1577897 RepID=UPI00057FE5CB|nr:ParB N-terminal domain-containing protein [Leisingera sp. ANG-DT]KIC18698.1 chromosome partitioning protein ParB [Leisingera sp. ANG-DT]